MKEYPVRAATPDHAGQGSCDLRAIDPLASFSCRLALQSGVPASKIQQSCLAVVSVTIEQSLPRLSIVSSISSTCVPAGRITVFGIWMSDGNQLPPAGETACPTLLPTPND